MKINPTTRKPRFVRVVLCRWGLVLAVAGYSVLFVAEVVELHNHPSAVGWMKLIGYAILASLVAVKAYKAIRNGKFFATSDNSHELH